MKLKQIFRAIMNVKDVKVSTLCNRTGIPQSTVSTRLAQDNVTMKKVNELVRAMDYKVVIVPAETRVQEMWFEIDW